MKKLFVTISIIAFVLLAAAEFYVQSDSFALRIRPLVVARLKAVLGSEVEIGWVRANFIPMYLEARDISLLDERGRQVAAIRKIKVYISPLPLILKKISLSSVSILEPHIFAERTKDGAFNLTPIVDRIKKNIGRVQAGGASDFRIVLRTVTINQGKISFNDGMTSTHVDVSQLQVNTSVGLTGNSMKVALKNSEIHVTAPAYPELSGSLRASIWYDNGRFHLDSTELTSVDTAISLSGGIGPLPDAPLDLRLEVRSGPQTLERFANFLKPVKKEQGPHVEASVSIRGYILNPSIEGTLKFYGISYQGMQLQDAALSFGYGKKSLTLTGKKWKLTRGNKSIIVDSINAALGYSERGLDIKQFDVLAGDLSVQIAGRTDPERGFDAELTAGSNDMGRTLSFLTSIPLEGRIGVKGALTGSFKEPLFDGVVSAGSLTIRGVLFDKAEGRLQYRDKKISLISADIHQQTSRYLFDGSVDLMNKEPLFAARLKVIRSEVGNIVALFYGPLPLHLPSTGELTFNGTVQKFTGSGRLAIESGSAYGESFNRGTITASLTRDRISFPQVQLIKGSGTVQGAGWIGFDGSYSAHIESSGVKLGEIDHLAGVPVDGHFNLDIGSSGSFSHPRVTASFDMDEFFYNQTGLGSLTTELEIADGVLSCRTQLADDRTDITARLALSKPYGWSLQATINADTIDPFVAVGKKDLLGRTRLIADGNLFARGNGTDLSALSGTASFKRLGLVMGDYRIDNDGEATVTVRGGRLGIPALNFKGPGTRIAVTGGARLMKDLDLSFTGTVHLSLLRILYREVEHGDGTAEVKLTVQDAWKNPEVAGELRINNGEIKIKDIPQKFTALQGTLTF
ncbi:MAG TPA: AsmA family protein, partial [Nitrospirota bacterium]|nr:AsmA family protein [Nitrospirota bacterium]